MSRVPIVALFESLPEEARRRLTELAAKCEFGGFAEELGRLAGRKVRESEARYLYLELAPHCAETKRRRPALEVKRVSIDDELDFLYAVVRRRIMMALELEESQGVPLSITDRMLEVAKSILELKSKVGGGQAALEELAAALGGGTDEGGG